MFEALRGLRDAVAPESGNLGNCNNNNNILLPQHGGGEGGPSDDVEEFWQAYCHGDEAVVALVKTSGYSNTSNSNDSGNTIANSKTGIQKRSDFVAWYSRMEREKDRELAETLAAAVLLKSEQIDEALLHVPGIHRTRAEQLRALEELIGANAVAAAELESVYRLALSRRDACREWIRNETATALGIEEEI